MDGALAVGADDRHCDRHTGLAHLPAHGISGLDHIVAPQTSNWIQLALPDAEGFDSPSGKGVTGITLLQGDLMSIVEACRLSLATMRNIRQSPIFAAAAMSLSSVSVIINALRLG